LTEDQYKKLCSICDSILLADSSALERIAIPWLNVIREHPIFLKQYEGIFTKLSPIKKISNYLYTIAKNIALSFRLIQRIVRSSGHSWYGKINEGESFDFVFVSHLLSLSDLANDKDFYFGSVPLDLAQQGKNVLLVLINYTTAMGSEMDVLLEKSKIPKVVISNGLSLKDEFCIWLAVSRQASSLRREAKLEKDKLRQTILTRAAIEASATNSKTSLRIAKVLKKIVACSNVKALVTTYEGHAWERVAYASVRDVNPAIACIAYQHAALFRLQHASRRSLGPRYDPDLILAAGPVGLYQIHSSPSMHSIPARVLGSPRSISLVNRNKEGACLVLPEGSVDECKILFEFALRCAEDKPKLVYIFRIHPILNYDKLVKEIPLLNSLPSNVRISHETLENDLACSAWVLYRGSTAAITAAANGVTPIYLKRPNELSIDPLYEVTDWHSSVESKSQFFEALKCGAEQSNLVKYCRNFYTPMNPSSLVGI
jgi:hypothetical protein